MISVETGMVQGGWGNCYLGGAIFKEGQGFVSWKADNMTIWVGTKLKNQVAEVAEAKYI